MLAKRVGAAAVGAGLPAASLPNFLLEFLSASATVSSVTGVTPDVLQAAAMMSREVYLDAFKPVWYTSVGIGCTALIAAILTKDVSPA